jgi:hypothetical protein
MLVDYLLKGGASGRLDEAHPTDTVYRLGDRARLLLPAGLDVVNFA